MFSYYIITSLLLNNYIGFIKWCETNNTNFISFHKTPATVKKYVDHIKTITKNKQIKKNISRIGDIVNKVNDNPDCTLQMSVLDLWEIHS